MIIYALLAALAAQDQPIIRTQANEVLVDVVVRDKKGKLIRGLQVKDFTVLEDGAPQTIITVREIAGGSVTAPGATMLNAPAVDPARSIRLFTLVFDRLNPDARRLARVAAIDLVKEDPGPNVFFSVFTSDLRLHLVQPFTNDRAKLRGAIEKAAGATSTDYANAAIDLQRSLDSTKGSEGAADRAASSNGQNIDAAGMAAEAMNRTIRDMLEFAETSTREQGGRASIFSLWGIVREQHRLPGRKTLLYFSEGLQVPNSVQNQFRNMMAAANRANVAIYAIDARGLSTAEDNQFGRDLLDRNVRVSQGTYRSTTQSSAVTREEVMQFDRALDSIRANPQIVLAELAEGTGGFLIANTNDFRQPLRRLTEEIGSYYEVVYRPANSALDGAFRAISVKAGGPEAKIQTRNGYFAVPALDGQSVLPYEVPLLAALNGKPLPRALDFRAAVLRQRPPDGAVLVFDMPLNEITFRENGDKSGYRTHFSFLALVKDEQGHVVDRVSRDLPMEEPAARLEGFRQGRAIFAKPLKLAPGRYTLESAAADRIGEKVSARRTSVVVPVRQGLALGGIVLVRRGDQAPPNPDPADPFLVGDKKIVPMLGDRVPGGAGKVLSLYFVVYTMAAGDRPKLTMDFYRDGQRLGGGLPELPASDAQRRIPYLAHTPLDNFTPGLYEVRVRVAHAGLSDQQSLFVTIE